MEVKFIFNELNICVVLNDASLTPKIEASLRDYKNFVVNNYDIEVALGMFLAFACGGDMNYNAKVFHID